MSRRDRREQRQRAHLRTGRVARLENSRRLGDDRRSERVHPRATRGGRLGGLWRVNHGPVGTPSHGWEACGTMSTKLVSAL